MRVFQRPATLDAVSGMLQVMVECVDFSPYTPTFQQKTKCRFCSFLCPCNGSDSERQAVILMEMCSVQDETIRIQIDNGVQPNRNA